MDVASRIYIAGHRGMVGSAILRQLKQKGYKNLITKARTELDLTDSKQVEAFLKHVKPEYIFLAAAKVGGILANTTYPAEFLYENLAIQTNIIHQACFCGVTKLLFLGSSCIYPKQSPQPIREESLLTGPLEPTNEPYAIAKIAGIKMCQAYNRQYGTNFISVMPANLYGPNDNFDLDIAHVLPALIRKFHEAKGQANPSVEVWGSGNPRREFLHVDDLADACLFLMRNYNESNIINIGTGIDLSISELADKIKKILGYKGEIVFDLSKPDGTIQKLLDVSKINSLGWKHRFELDEGISATYEWFRSSYYNH